MADMTYVDREGTEYTISGTGLQPDYISIGITNNKLAVKDGGITADKIATGAVTDAKIGTRTLADEAADGSLISIAAKTLTAWLQGIRNNLKSLFENKVDKLTGSTDCDRVYVKHADGTQGYQELWAEPVANSIPSRDDNGALYAQAGGGDTAVVIKSQMDSAIADAQLSTHTWLPAVQTKADLPVPPKPDTLNYLCRVIADGTAANNGVWEWIAGADEWTYFSDNLDFVDETELQTALSSKQDTLASGENIKTINSESLLGAGNIVVEGAAPDGVTIEKNSAGKLAVKDGGISSAKIADSAVTSAKIAGNAVTAAKLAYTLDLSSASYTVSVKTPSVPSS
jgi:hypothetical protein